MSDLPDGWEWATLGELCEFRPGFASGRHNRSGDGIVHIRPMNITRTGSLDLSDARYVSDESDRRVAIGDILFNNTNSPDLVGKTALVDVSGELAYSNHMTRLRPTEDSCPAFIALQLYTAWVNGYFKSVMSHHVNQASVSTSVLMRTSMAVPPIAEQRRIIAALGGHLSRVEAGMQSLACARKKIGNAKEQLFELAITGSLGRHVPEVSNSSVRGLEGKSGTRVNYNDAFPLPREWRWAVASEVCESISSGSTPKSHQMNTQTAEVPFLKVYNITKEGNLDFSISPTFIDRDLHCGAMSRSVVHSGEVLTNIVGPPLGKSAVVPDLYPEWNINQAIVAFRAGPDLLPSWVSVVLRSPSIVRMLKSTSRATAGQFNISLSACRELPLPVPPLEQQEILVRDLGDLQNGYDRSIAVLASTEKRAEHLRRSLLREAFAGRLVEQDPADEPATVLLERIRAQRESMPKVKRTRKTREKKTASGGAGAGIAKSANDDPLAAEGSADRPLPESVGKGTQDALDLGL